VAGRGDGGDLCGNRVVRMVIRAIPLIVCDEVPPLDSLEIIPYLLKSLTKDERVGAQSYHYRGGQFYVNPYVPYKGGRRVRWGNRRRTERGFGSEEWHYHAFYNGFPLQGYVPTRADAIRVCKIWIDRKCRAKDANILLLEETRQWASKKKQSIA